MKKVLLITGLILSLAGSAQHYIQASIQQGATPNSVNILFLPNYTRVAGEYVNYLSLSIAIPASSATGVTPSLTMTGPFTGMTMNEAIPFSYTSGAFRIFSWVYNSGPSAMTWTSGTPFVGATITFSGGTGSANVSLVDFSTCGVSGGDNSNTYFLVITNISPFDVTNYSSMFYPIGGSNGSTIGIGPCGEPLIRTDLPIFLSSVCPEPTTPTVNPVTTTIAHVAWNSVPGISSYEYQVSTNSNPSGGAVTNNLSFDTSGLTVGTKYYFHIRSICSPGNFSNWTSVDFTTVCPTVTSITTPVITPSSVKIQWQSIPPSALGYQYVLDKSPDNPSPTVAIAILEDSVTIPALTEGTTYYVHVRANCSPGIFSAWDTKSFTTSFKPCSLPGLPTVIPGGNDVKISWGAAVGSIGYQYAVIKSSAAPSFGVPASTNSGQADDLNTNTQYYVFVRSECRPGVFSEWVSTSFKTNCLKPAPFLIENSSEEGTAKVGWRKINGIINYEYAILPTAVPPSGSFNTITDTVLQVYNLKPGTKYYLHVRTHCSASIISDWSTLDFYTSGISVIPNPFNSVIKVTLYGNENLNEGISLFDVTGKLLQKIELGNNTINLNLINYPAGVYFIRLNSNRKCLKKIIKL